MLTMQIAAGPWILEATRPAPSRPVARKGELVVAAPVRPQPWKPPVAQERGVLIDLIV